jgi:hypothetical protein
MSDSPRVTDQTALTSSSGRSWLVVGGLIGLLSVVLLAALHELPPRGAALIGGLTIVVLYLGMIAVRFGTAPGRVRLALLAAATIAICVAFVVVACVIAVAGSRVG